VLPPSVVGDLVDIDVVFDPWPDWLVGQVLVDWNWMWNSPAMAETAICLPSPALKPAADKKGPAISPLPKPKAARAQPPLKQTQKTPPRRTTVIQPEDPPPPRRRSPYPVYDQEPPTYSDNDGYGPGPPRYFPPRPGVIIFPPRGGFGIGGYGGAPSGMGFPGRGTDQGYGRR
jgi:hypothetical protein